MVATSFSDVGRMVHERLLAEGGFCWDHRADGMEIISVHVNKGRVMSAELRKLLKRHGAELKAYVFEKNDLRRRMDVEAEARWAVMCGRAAPGGVGSSSPVVRRRRTREGSGVCDCSGAAGSDLHTSSLASSGGNDGAGLVLSDGTVARGAGKVDFTRNMRLPAQAEKGKDRA